MRSIFSWKRFSRLFIKHSIEHYKAYLMALSVLAGVMILGGTFMVYMVEFPIDKNFQTVAFMIFLLLAGTIYTSGIFSELEEKKRAIAWLMLPASHFEKFLVAWLYSLVIFVVVYAVSFYCITLLAVNLQQFPGRHTVMFSFFESPILQMVAVYAFLHAAAICGSVWFEKLRFIKTGFVFFISLALLIMINKIVMGSMIGIPVRVGLPFSNLWLYNDDQYQFINVTSRQPIPYIIYVVLALAVIGWMAAYQRLKEKQV